MPLSRAVVDFLVAWEALSPGCTRHSWGTLVFDERFPSVWDSNRALVVGGVTPSLDAVMATLEQRRPESVRFQRVEVVDVDAHARLSRELRGYAGEPERFVVMVIDAATPMPQPADDVEVVERGTPDAQAWLRVKQQVFEGELDVPEPVLRQLASRDVAVFFPAGRRVFEARREHQSAGIATLLTLRQHRVGLIDDVATVPRHRRRGVAAALMHHVVSASRQTGDDVTVLFTAEHGDGRRLYERLGFCAVAVSAQYHREI